MGLAEGLPQPFPRLPHPGLECTAEEGGVGMALHRLGMISHLIEDAPVSAFFLDPLFSLGVGVEEQIVEDCALACIIEGLPSGSW